MRPSRIAVTGRRSSGTVTLRLSRGLWTQRTRPPMRSTSDESSGTDKALGNRRGMGTLHRVDAKDLRRLRGPIELARRRLDDIIAVDDLERVDRG